MFDRNSSGSRIVAGLMTRTDRGRSQRIHRLAIVLFFLLTSGCAHYRSTQSGFLTDYSQIEKDRFHLNHGVGVQRAKTHYATSEQYRSIDSFYIEPTQWLVDPKSRAGKDSKRRDPLVSKLGAELHDQLGQVKPIVEVPGPHTATIRSAITTVRLSRPLLNLVLTATLWTPVAIGPIFFGGAAIEVEAIGPNGRQIAAVSTASSGGLIDFRGYYSKSGHALKALRRNVKEFKEALID